MTTPYNTKYAILSDLWTNYKDDKEMADFFAYNDLGLPLAFMIEQKIVESTPVAQVYIEETFELLVESLGLDPEEEYESLSEMLDLQAENEEDDV
jgi:hypothetical protein